MKKLFDVNVEEHKTTNEKITINLRNFNIQDNIDKYSEIKCFKNFEEVTTLEVRKINLIKIQKTIFLNLLNLIHVDLRENKLLKISRNFQSLKNLKSLKLDDNSISYIPSFIGNIEKLEVFTICNNKIKYLPTSIQYLQKLKVLKLSNNQITTIPIEFGLLKQIECLYIDANHFTEIPTTFCYLKHLSEFGFEWFEFLDPPFQKVIKENIGKTIISLIRNSLQEMIKQNILYCDLITFIKRNSNQTSRRESTTNNKFETILWEDGSNENESPMNKKLNTLSEKVMMSNETENGVINHKKMMKIFYAIDNNYFGVIKALIDSNKEYQTIKNNDNKTPLYLSIQNNKIEITNLILTQIDFNIINNSHIYLHKAIRMRDPVLTEKLINMGIDIDSADDQGATCFHVLFSSFNKQFYKCSVIGDILLRKNCKLNSLNNDSWAPIHIAARRSAKECIEWIINQNKLLESQMRDTFDLNLKGKNKWTPLHLAVNGFRLEETIMLLEAGSDVFVKNSDGKLPSKVANGNYLLTKLLRNYENSVLSKKYFTFENKNENFVNNRFSTVQDISNIDDHCHEHGNDSFFKHTLNLNETSKLITTTQFSEIKNNSISNKTVTKESIEKLHNSLLPTNKNLKSVSYKINSYDRDNNVRDTPKFNQINSVDFNNVFKSKSKKSLIPIPTNFILKQTKSQMFSRKPIQVKTNNKILSTNIRISKIKKVNLHFHKEIILNPECSLSEKFESLMQIKFTSSLIKSLEVENIIKSILEAIDLDTEINMIIFVDVLDLIIVNQFFDLISFLEMMQRSIKKKNLNFLVEKELSNCVEVLKAIQDSFKKTILIDQDISLISSRDSKRRDKKQNRNIIVNGNNNFNNVKKHTKSSLTSTNLKLVNSIPKMKNITKYFESDTSKVNREIRVDPNRDDFNDREMNEISRSYIDFNHYNQQPRNFLNLDKIRANNYTINDESCNIADSSWSATRYEDHNTELVHDGFLTSQQSNNNSLNNSKLEDVKCDLMKLEGEEEIFQTIPPKRIDSSFLDI